MEALNQGPAETRSTLMGLVALGLFNSVVSAFYYVRVLKAMYLREPGAKRLGAAERSIEIPIVIGTLVVVVFGLFPSPLISMMQAASEPMLTATGGYSSAVSPPSATGYAPVPPASTKPAPRRQRTGPRDRQELRTIHADDAIDVGGGQVQECSSKEGRSGAEDQEHSSKKGRSGRQDALSRREICRLTRIHKPTRKLPTKHDKRQSWPSSTRSRSAWRVPISSRTKTPRTNRRPSGQGRRPARGGGQYPDERPGRSGRRSFSQLRGHVLLSPRSSTPRAIASSACAAALGL